MNYLSDLHTHTIVSGHAYTTLMENIDFCSKKGIKILGTSDHGPTMPGSPHYWYFGNLKVVPRIINDVIILKGCEANILDVDGNIDIPNNAMKNLDYMIASFHEPVFEPKSLEENTNAIMIEINNSSLSGGSRIGSNVNCEKVALLCKKHGTKVILTSDAHINLKICDFSKSIELLNKIEMPKELIMNEPDKLIAHLKSKGRLQDL